MKLSEDTSSLFGGEELWPPGFRFHPTDEELVLYYLKRKICRRRLKIDAIAEVDVYKADPEDLPQLSKLKTGDRQWFFFSARDRKYPNGGRSNRATRNGYWKATGKDRAITCNSRSVGIKKTLVFYRGRAPSGERTDWVMHEYTVDEEELKTCPVQDYYALYKVYKKSGPGPKNGEQYGAPFREEDWADDEKAIVVVDKEQVTPLQQFSQHATSFDKTGMNCQIQSHVNGLDDLLNQIMNEPLFEPISQPYGTVQVASRDSILVNRSLGEPNVQERQIVVPQFIGIQPHFNLIQSACSQLPETSGVTNMNRQEFHDSAENFIEHFLEIDDLIGPEPTKENNENPIIDDFGIEDFDGLCELDLFQDAIDAEPASLSYNNHVGDHICDTIPISYTTSLGNGVMNQVPYSYLNNFQTEIVQPNSQPYHNSLGNDLVNKFNYQLPHKSAVANQPWMPNQNFSMAASAVSIEGPVTPPSSGAVYSGGGNQNHNQTQNQIGDNNKGEDSWFSSALWSFVETIPTTPASAAESTALVTKAFGRLSSFGKRGDGVKVRQLYTKFNAGDPNANCQRSQNSYNRNLLLFSFLGVFCAFLWVFTGTSMRVLGRCLS